jgi:hypothetical protein
MSRQEEGQTMRAPWRRIAIAVVLVVVVVGLALLEMIAERARVDTVIAGIAGSVADWQSLRFDVAWLTDSGRQ